MIPRARPVDIPADLAAWIEIGGPWSVRLIYGDGDPLAIRDGSFDPYPTLSTDTVRTAGVRAI